MTEDMNSILVSVKKNLGILEDILVFDDEITMHINSAILTLSQLGVGPAGGFIVTSKDDTYEDWLKDSPVISMVKIYLFYKTKRGFDSSTSSTLSSTIDQEIAELEWRMREMCEPNDTFDLYKESNSEEGDEGG